MKDRGNIVHIQTTTIVLIKPINSSNFSLNINAYAALPPGFLSVGLFKCGKGLHADF